jgi:predicted aspartyl protease
MRRFSALAALGAAATLLLGAPSAALAACTMKAAPIPVKMIGLQPTVPVTVNGKSLTFLVDSGAFFNGVNIQFANDQKMKRAQETSAHVGSHLAGDAETGVSGVGGRLVVSSLVRADEFQFAGVSFRNAVFLTVDLNQGGLIGQNLLGRGDVEYDLRNGVMKLVEVKDCKTTEMAYWVTSGTYSMLPLDPAVRGDPHTLATVFINGVQMRAVFDTGAPSSFVTRRAAARAGVQVTDPGVTEAGWVSGVDRSRVKVWVARFASVKVADEEIKNGLLEIGQTDAPDFDVLIGADFFLAHHVYVANSQQKLYFSYSGGRVFNVAPQPDPADPAPAESSPGPAR